MYVSVVPHYLSIIKSPLSTLSRQGGQPDNDDAYLPTYLATRAEHLHDPSRLPHKHSDTEISELFPIIEAAAAPDNCDDYDADTYVRDKHMAVGVRRRQQGDQRGRGHDRDRGRLSA